MIYSGLEGQQNVKSFVSVVPLYLWIKVQRREPGPLQTSGSCWASRDFPGTLSACLLPGYLATDQRARLGGGVLLSVAPTPLVGLPDLRSPLLSTQPGHAVLGPVGAGHAG